jgi:lysozyme
VAAPKKSSRSVRRRRIPFLNKKVSKGLYIVVFLLALVAVGYRYRMPLAYYFGFKTHKSWTADKEHFIRNIQVLERQSNYVAGIDVSEYQGEVDWTVTDSVEDTYPIGFVFIRATYGQEDLDREFRNNWREVKKTPMVRGAYHYYRPDENSIKQAQNYIDNVKLESGDLPPVLDVERIPEDQSIDSLKVGIRRWLRKVEKLYGMRPIIYSGEKYYLDFLKDEFKTYTVWVANYNFHVEEIDPGWQFWQFTQNGTAKGIDGDVDINIFNGDGTALRRIRKK